MDILEKIEEVLDEVSGTFGGNTGFRLQGKTSKDKGHDHTYKLDDRKKGTGKTSTDEGHFHNIDGFEVEEANGHKHELESAESIRPA